jgi:signal peptidase I
MHLSFLSLVDLKVIYSGRILPMFGFSTVIVSGNSMAPSYKQGDWLIVRILSGKKHTLKIGVVYLVQDPNRPGVKLLKRLKESRMEHGVTRYWVEGDNPLSEDSRIWGWIESGQFLAKVMLKYKKAVIE